MGLVEDVGERLVRFRVRAGFEPAAAAARARIDPDRLDEAEAGKLTLSDEEIARIAEAYAIDATEIFGGRITPLQDYAGGA